MGIVVFRLFVAKKRTKAYTGPADHCVRYLIIIIIICVLQLTSITIVLQTCSFLPLPPPSHQQEYSNTFLVRKPADRKTSSLRYTISVRRNLAYYKIIIKRHTLFIEFVATTAETVGSRRTLIDCFVNFDVYFVVSRKRFRTAFLGPKGLDVFTDAMRVVGRHNYY